MKQKHLQKSPTTCTSSIKDLTFPWGCDPVSSHHPAVTPPLSDLLRSSSVMGARHRPSGSGPFLPHNRVSQPTGSSRHLRSRVIALAIPEALITQARWSQSPLICHKNNEYAVARFLYSWIYGYLDCFHFVTVMNNVFLNLHV